MKKITLAVLGCTMAFSAMAHRDVYYSHGFANAENLGHASWSFTGAVFEEGEATPILMCTGDYMRGQKTSLEIKHDQRANGERLMPYVSEAHLSLVIGTENANPKPHVTPVIVLKDEYGEELVFHFAMLEDNLELDQNVTSTSMSGTVDVSEFGRVNEFSIFLDGIEEEEIVSPTSVCLCSDWIMPVVNTSREVENVIYNRGPGGNEAKAGEVVTTKGITFIQAEDFDEPWINGHVGHTTCGGSNGMRLYKEDMNVDIKCDSWGWGDGSPYGHWYKDHGHVIGNRWAGNDDILPTTGWSGYVLEDWSPAGKSDDGFKYKGEYQTPGPDDDPEITLEDALKCWTMWAEYTFEVEEDCLIDVSLKVGAHRGPFEAGMSTSLYWWDDKALGGYGIIGHENDPYMKLFGYKYTMAVDGEMMRTAYDSAPVYVKGCNGDEFMKSTFNPSKWTNTQETVNGTKENSYYLYVHPYSFWGYNENAGIDEQGSLGNGWYAFYKSDILDKALEYGLITPSVHEQYAHGDYMNIPVSKGRHTIKVSNLGGNSWFDEIRIQAHDGTGSVEGIFADDFEGAPVYYDLQGRQIQNPANGLYIVKRGSKVTKEVIR